MFSEICFNITQAIFNNDLTIIIFSLSELEIKPDVAGATFMAIGSSAPEFFSALIGRLCSDLYCKLCKANQLS